MADKKTLIEKVWDNHLVHAGSAGEPDLLYIDLHLVHEVTSPQAFDGLRIAGRTVRRPDLTVATEDHNVPTENIDQPIADPVSRKQVETLRANAAEFGITNHEMGSPGQGIVHVIGPEQGLTQPGMTVLTIVHEHGPEAVAQTAVALEDRRIGCAIEQAGRSREIPGGGTDVNGVVGALTVPGRADERRDRRVRR